MPKRKSEREQNYLGSKELESYERKQKDKGKKTQKKRLRKLENLTSPFLFRNQKSNFHERQNIIGNFGEKYFSKLNFLKRGNLVSDMSLIFRHKSQP